MHRVLPALIILPLTTAAVAQPLSRGDRWWADIATIADDKTEGRQPGSPGYLLAADFVESRFKAIGLQPAGTEDGFRQDVALEEQRIDYAGSSAQLVDANGTAASVALGIDMLVSAGGGPRPETIDAPLVFIGYGLHLPDQGHDDFAGVDLKGKIAVVIAGGPASIPGPVKASNRAERATLLGKAGAVGIITLTPPKQIEIPWERQKLLTTQAGMYLADGALRDVPDGFLSASFDPDASNRLFEGSGHRFDELAAASDASRPIPGFALPYRLKAHISAKRRQLSSPNLVARLEGSDPALRHEYVVVSAHLDHIGVGAPINGDAIYNGAMDDASGVASVLDIATELKAGPRPKRSFLFVIVTAEEKGLLGSGYFAKRPTVPRQSIVANLNFDMPLPLWPLTSVLVQGDHESTLGDQARSVAAGLGLTLIADPLPNRNSFVRTDQYSFVREGIPALAFKFGFPPGSDAFRIEHDWRANRYHAPSDDLNQPGVLRDEAVKLDHYVAMLARTIADDPARPRWLESSIFKQRAVSRTAK
ncbi:peptidase M28 [Sphingobium sp. SCG-1]|uniref:M28 family metallopeptidase n=1 Tax=Sphingobium sp. SCG-1 TaxID=2072936 RepID=UPI000CD6BD9B|nr:M28 family metallopeptidase [Sphingobium sp. SCG-1]AUW59457.1 peptidase M28 [Sphingobium sp. SCG-1]